MKSLHIFIFLLINLMYHSTISQEKYFQQKVDTYIDVELDDKKHFLYGFEKIVYTNNSNQNLDSILIHLWPNAYQNIDTELGKQKIEDGQLYIKYAPNYTRGYIDSLEFKVNSKAVKWKLSDKHIDIAILSLNNSLKKGDSIEIRELGRWYCKKLRENHNARNPKTNELIYKPERIKVRFKPSKNLKKKINE